MGEHEVIGKQVVRIQDLEKTNDILISAIVAIKKGNITLDQIELQDNGFIINDNEEEV
tara:strand:- start:332 stop:505 length:174 start_codon:yes stop_codon:yes gene_type:complete